MLVGLSRFPFCRLVVCVRVYRFPCPSLQQRRVIPELFPCPVCVSIICKQGRNDHHPGGWSFVQATKADNGHSHVTCCIINPVSQPTKARVGSKDCHRRDSRPHIRDVPLRGGRWEACKCNSHPAPSGLLWAVLRS